ncbi:stage V sporulation protein D (sporulation-specific penicillin-binding protein) [Tumebacillus permanentifrigoris]|uniref:Stage V sporulation protein D (Sporulation-specific penicillin-binding protein) n=2 Tax=Tumebacillus permanentifrigoris TaxID=378543 RepID=A0A316D7I6_9BACL|nr:stage V sporulation protein D (sporulation-specific penicillin-binding protein) [Tumebacillus permanentifrigoris]
MQLLSQVTLRKRLMIVLAGLAVVFLVLILRLGYIQMIQAPWLTEQAEDLWRRNIPVEPKRGSITDRNGEVLAYNGSAPTVVVIPAQVKDKAGTAEKLAPVLEMPKEKVQQLISRRTLLVYLAPGGRKVTDEKAKLVRDLNLTGIYVTEEGKRYYPDDGLAAHILGFAGVDNQGLTGVESWYNNRLEGKPGRISFFANARGEEMPQEDDEYVAPQNGQSLTLTIDKEIQTFVEREIENVNATYNPDGVMVIVADPKTGEILALANSPSFKNGSYRSYPQETYNRDLAIWKNFEPGSTFKIVTLAAALEEKKITLNDPFYDPGYYTVGGRNIRCWKAGGHGQETMLDVVENSCNPGFMLMGQKLGKEKLFDYINKFGFGQKTGIDLPGEGKGILFNVNKVTPVDLATTSFGQGVSVTPIQQVMAVSAVANGGTLYKPHLAKAWSDPETGQVIEDIKPEAVRRVVSEDTARQVRETLESVVARGSGKNAYLDGYRVGGKTGTAQVAENGAYKKGHYIVSFIGMAPVDNPRLVAYIAIDNPKAPLIFGGVIAAPVVGNILGDSLHYLNVPTSKAGLAKEYTYFDPKPIEVPQISGLTVEEAQKEMYGSGLQLKTESAGQGKYIVDQSPAAGTKVPAGSTIRLYLSDQPAQKSP